MSGSGMRRATAGGLGAIIVGAALSATAVQAQTVQPVYPSAMDKATLLAWLKAETDIAPNAVVAISPTSLTSILSTRQGPTDGTLGVVIRTEALSPEGAGDGLSTNASLEVDCRGYKVKSGPVTAYADRNLMAASKPLRPADAAWRTPAPGGDLEMVVRAACEKDFKRPLVDGERPLNAQVTVPPPAASVAAAPAPPRPAAAAPTTAGAGSQAAAPRAPARTPAAAPTPHPGTAKVAAQIAAAFTAAEARKALAAVRANYPEKTTGLVDQISVAKVRGRTYHRAMFRGFDSMSDAEAFCDALTDAGQACFLRTGRG